MTNANLAGTYVKHYRLKLGRPKKLGFKEVAEIRQVMMNAWADARPETPHEIDFLRNLGCHPNALTEGYLERRKAGVEIVLVGRAPDNRSVWLVFSLPYQGDPMLSSKIEILPGEPGYAPAA